jgi:hypothetical protein
VRELPSQKGASFNHSGLYGWADRSLPPPTHPREAFLIAINECARTELIYGEIPTGSLDLVTSTMVVSQFDHEPYTYFPRVLEAHFGRDKISKTR